MTDRSEMQLGSIGDLQLDSRRHAQDLRNTWQARALAETKGRLAAVIFAVLMHSYKPAMQILMRVVFPKAPIARNGWPEISLPAFAGCATILPSGVVACKTINRDRRIVQNGLVYSSEALLIKEMRDLADRLKFTDQERLEFTEAVKRWVVRDMRVNHFGQKVAV